MRPFEWNHIPALFYDSMLCVFLPKCVFFYQWCLSGLSSQHYVSMIFVGKKMHTLPRCGLIFPFQMPYLLHWLFMNLHWPTYFCCVYFPKSVTNLHRLFNISCINTHFEMFLNFKLRHVWESYISWYVLGGMSLTCLPIFAWEWGRKHNNTVKNAAFWVAPHSCLILWQHGVFSFTKVCIFLPNQDFHHNIMFLWFLKQCW